MNTLVLLQNNHNDLAMFQNHEYFSFVIGQIYYDVDVMQ